MTLGTEAEAVALVLQGLSSRGGAREAALVTGYDADGDAVGTLLVHENGPTRLAFDEPVAALAIEAAAWQGGDAAPAANPDFSLAWIDPL